MGVEARQDLAAAIAREVDEWDGEGFARTEVLRPTPNFASGNLYWVAGTPKLADFVAPESLLIFDLLGQQPDDLQWLNLPLAEWDNHVSYTELRDYVRAKSVVNDPAERSLGLIKPIVKNFKKEEHLQAAMQVTKKTREAWPTGTIRGRKKKNMAKKELSKIKPSELLKREEDVVNTSSEEEDLEDPNDDVLDL